MDLKKTVENLLPFVAKPISYQGHELGAVHKTLSPEMIRFAFAFPDTYEVGMSHLGLKILYALLNDQEDIACERVFAPWTDMEALMRENQVPLFALESGDPITAFDFVGFTLQYEMCYSNVLNMLDLSGIPLLSKDREAQCPMVIAGGPCTCNPEPLADIIDLFVIGEGEEVILELMDLYKGMRSDRKGFLKAAAGIEGVYVPALYEPQYDESGRYLGLFNIEDGTPAHIRKRFVADLEQAYYPRQLIVPYTETVHDRVSMELFRGCSRGCRFCQAGIIYRPIRERSRACIEAHIDTLLRNTGYDEVGLASLSSGDYSEISELIHDLVARYESEEVGVSLPSLRIDSVSIDMLEEIQKIRKTGITLAPEAGTQRMRDVINKGVTEEDLLSTVRPAFEKGWGHIKLYFMMGLPTETEADIQGIAHLSQAVVEAYHQADKATRNRSCKVVVSTSCFIPKPHTPFQWVGQNTRAAFLEKQKLLKQAIKDKHISYNWHDAETSYYEAIFARGDRALSAVLIRAHELGCRFDGWQDHFKPDLWQQAFDQAGIDGDAYALRERALDEVLPWDHIDVGVTKAFLIKEYEKALAASVTPDCRKGCGGCGIMQFKKGWQCHGCNPSL